MSEEEKAIEILKYTRDKCRESGEGRIYFYRVEDLSNAIETLLNLIEKQQKEIEELKKPKYIIDSRTGTVTKIDNEFISKDKIREKIKEYESTLNQNLFTKIQVIEHGFPKENPIQIAIKAKVETLKELLEE